MDAADSSESAGASPSPSPSLSLVCDALLIAIFLVATVCNSLVMLVFYRKPGLRTLSNRFVLNLVVTNLVSCWVLAPLALLDRCEPQWRTVGSAAATGLCAATVLSVLLIGIDQYYAVIDPLRYHSIVNNTRSVCMIAASWCFSVVCAALGSLCYRPAPAAGVCDDSDSATFFLMVPDAFVSAFSFAYPAIIFILPFATICKIYTSIYSAAHQNSQRTRRNGSTSGFNPTQNGCEAGTTEYAAVPRTTSEPTMTRSPTKTSLRSTSSFIVNSLRCRISNASLFKYRREEARAARISALVAIMGLACWCPFSLIVLSSAPAIGLRPPAPLAKLGLTLLLLGTVVSPLLFAHRNRRVQRDLRKLFGLTSRPAHRPVPRASPSLPMLELQRSGSFLRGIWWREGVRIVSDVDKLSGTSLICVPEAALGVDNGRSSFSSGASSSTQRSTSAASISSLTADDC